MTLPGVVRWGGRKSDISEKKKDLSTSKQNLTCHLFWCLSRDWNKRMPTWHLPPPSWFFMGQLNPESYLPLGQAKFVCKIFLQTELKYVFLNLHILYNGTIYGIYCIDYRASWQAIGQTEIMPSLHPPWQVLSHPPPPWASAFQNRMSTPAASRIMSVDVCSERICFACCWGLVGLGRFIGASI